MHAEEFKQNILNQLHKITPENCQTPQMKKLLSPKFKNLLYLCKTQKKMQKPNVEPNI